MIALTKLRYEIDGRTDTVLCFAQLGGELQRRVVDALRDLKRVSDEELGKLARDLVEAIRSMSVCVDKRDFYRMLMGALEYGSDEWWYWLFLDNYLSEARKFSSITFVFSTDPSTRGYAVIRGRGYDERVSDEGLMLIRRWRMRVVSFASGRRVSRTTEFADEMVLSYDDVYVDDSEL